MASSLIAGADAGADGLFGTDDDELIAGGGSVIASIAKILIKGAATGTSDDATDHYGFVSEQIKTFKAAGAKTSLTSGAGNDLTGIFIGPDDDLRVREVV